MNVFALISLTARALPPDELAKIETQVNLVILENSQATTKLMSPDAAIEAGAMALFGEKYGEEVRVLSLGNIPKDEDHPYSARVYVGAHM